jgi:N-sulfoglucosamine sulfohydrolase
VLRTLLAAAALAHVGGASAADRPNIVLIGAEDISPDLGCYGQPDAVTPILDKFAAEGARFTRAFTHAPVCAPTRSGIITGQYPTTLGSHHMRSKLIKAPRMFTQDLRDAGYHVAWPAGKLGKTDFNFDPQKGFADSTADWTLDPGKLPQPFFAYANFTVSHESQARANPKQYAKNTARLTAAQRHDPARVMLPPYYPDDPAVRKVVATYHDNVTALDYQFGDLMAKLDAVPGVSENTVVVFFGDHGRGLPRGKRSCLDSGLRVPLLVRWPGHIKPGSVRDDLTCFLDLAPTFVALAGAQVPDRMGGRVFLGPKTQPAPKYVFAARDRMDETFDRVRSVRGENFRYVRNYAPEVPYAAWLDYQDLMPIMRVWREQAFAGKLNPTQMLFFARTKPKEELYDERTDPDEVKNRAGVPKYAAKLKEMSAALDKWVIDTKDLGAVPEQELIDRGIVKDVLNHEYKERLKEHPKTPPVPR